MKKLVMVAAAAALGGACFLATANDAVAQRLGGGRNPARFFEADRNMQQGGRFRTAERERERAQEQRAQPGRDAAPDNRRRRR